MQPEAPPFLAHRITSHTSPHSLQIHRQEGCKNYISLLALSFRNWKSLGKQSSSKINDMFSFLHIELLLVCVLLYCVSD